MFIIYKRVMASMVMINNRRLNKRSYNTGIWRWTKGLIHERPKISSWSRWSQASKMWDPPNVNTFSGARYHPVAEIRINEHPSDFWRDGSTNPYHVFFFVFFWSHQCYTWIVTGGEPTCRRCRFYLLWAGTHPTFLGRHLSWEAILSFERLLFGNN